MSSFSPQPGTGTWFAVCTFHVHYRSYCFWYWPPVGVADLISPLSSLHFTSHARRTQAVTFSLSWRRDALLWPRIRYDLFLVNKSSAKWIFRVSLINSRDTLCHFDNWDAFVAPPSPSPPLHQCGCFVSWAFAVSTLFLSAIMMVKN